jgi:hypothetical protein
VSYKYTGSQELYYPSLGLTARPGDELETRPDETWWAESAPSRGVNVDTTETTVDVPAPIESEKDTNEAVVPADEELK